MAISAYIDATADFNADGRTILDIGGFSYADVQFVSPSTMINFESSNDSGAIQGVSDGSAASATNFTSVQGTNLGSGSGASSTSTDGIFKFSGIGRYLRLIGAGATATKILVRLYKDY